MVMTMRSHPLAELFPLMDEKGLVELAADIKAHGLREPIILHEGRILDGRNRYAACRRVGVEPFTQPWDQKGSVVDFVVSKNLHRRHLNDAQRAMIAQKLENMKIGNAAAQRSDVARATSAVSRKEAAALLNVHPASVARAKVVVERGTREEVKAAQEGRLPLRTVAEQIRKGMSADERKASREQKPKRERKRQSRQREKERIVQIRTNGLLWQQLKDALNNLTSLPNAGEVAGIVRGMSSTAPIVDAKLNRAINWLGAFANAWNAETAAQDGTGAAHAQDGGHAA